MLRFSVHPARGLASSIPVLPIACLVIATCLVGCHSNDAEHGTAEAASNAELPPVPVSVASVQIRAVKRRVSVVGTLHGFDQITVTPKVEGRIQEIHFDIGDRVPPITTLLKLDPVDYQLAVEEAERALEQELSRLSLKAPPEGEFDVEKLPSVERPRLLLENARRQFERQKALLTTNAAARQIYEQAETDFKVADATLRQARIDALTTLATVRQRQAMVAMARQKLSETIVKSPPLDGKALNGKLQNFVVSKRMGSVGEVVRAFPSAPVFELVLDDVLKLNVLVPERYMAQVKQGLDLEVYVEAYPGEVFPGRVERINPTVDPQSRSFDVEAHVPNPDHRLKHGGFAKAEVIVATADEAVTVPIEAVTRFAGVTKIFRVRDEVAQDVEISIGTQGPGWIEALSELQAGDLVVTSGQSRLANGTRVTIRENVSSVAQRN